MSRLKTKRTILASFLPGLTSLTKRGSAGWMTLIGAIIVSSIVIMTLISPWITPSDPTATPPVIDNPLRAPPSWDFPMGTNKLGQDMLSRVLSGGAVMLQVAVLSVIFCFLLGVPIGLLASYRGGLIDKICSLVMDSFYAFPGLVLAIVVAAMMGRGVVNMALSIAVVYVPSYFRVVRSQVLTIKELPYTEAAQATGAKGRTILLRYILPNVVPSIVVVATVNFADAILTAAGLTFIGLGVGIDIPDWGWDLTKGFELLPSGAWWVITFPGIMIVLLALGFTLIGEGLSELLNPKLEQ
ncbi:MAG: ABC transporter permease [Candidatus Bathyarchaeota archaeon]|nr:ABC transporter permease [Candidatus Bathyarchaeota archaeon]